MPARLCAVGSFIWMIMPSKLQLVVNVVKHRWMHRGASICVLSYYELPYLAVAEECHVAVGHSLYLRLHDSAEESVAECEYLLARVLAAHLVKELVCALLHGLLGLHSLVIYGALDWGAGKVAEVALTQKGLLYECALNALKCNLGCVKATLEITAKHYVELQLGNPWAQCERLLLAKFRKVSRCLSLEQTFRILYCLAVAGHINRCSHICLLLFVGNSVNVNPMTILLVNCHPERK